jgi:hypothetical protein
LGRAAWSADARGAALPVVLRPAALRAGALVTRPAGPSPTERSLERIFDEALRDADAADQTVPAKAVMPVRRATA